MGKNSFQAAKAARYAASAAADQGDGEGEGGSRMFSDGMVRAPSVQHPAFHACQPLLFVDLSRTLPLSCACRRTLHSTRLRGTKPE